MGESEECGAGDRAIDAAIGKAGARQTGRDLRLVGESLPGRSDADDGDANAQRPTNS
jgi:hypothetical protein